MRFRKTSSHTRARALTGLALRSGSRLAVAGGRDRARNRLKPELVQLEDRQLLATFTVSNTLDTVNFGTPTTGTLRWAVEQADLAGGAEVISFSSSVFSTQQTITLEQLLTPIPMNTPGSTITINGPGAGLLTINGNNDGGVFQVDSGVTAAISGLTFTGASLGNNGAIDDLGSLTLSNCTIMANTISGVYVAGTANISDCIITGNNSYSGAGVFVKGGTATITDSTLSGNTGAQGGGVCNDGTATVTNCTLSGDSTLGGGGALYNSGQLTVNGCTLSGDSGSGAAVFNEGGTAYLSGTTISGSSGFIDGGGVSNQHGATLILTDCTVSGGTAGSGAGLYNDGTATITDCTISDNTSSGSGGGITNGDFIAAAVLILTDSTLVGNTAAFGGGGLYNTGTAKLTDSTIANNFGNQGGSLLASNGGGVDNDGVATLVACTISGNTTTADGGGVYNGGLGANQMTLNDTIVAGNSSTQSGGAVANDIAVGNGVSVAGSYDLIGTGGSGGLVNGDNGNIILTSLAGLDLAPLGDFGGPTETMGLLPNSVALGGGSLALELNAQGQALTTDQRGFPLISPNPDIGAFQADPGPLAVDVTTDGVGAPTGQLDLRGAVNLADILSGAATITFNPTVFATEQTIALAVGQLELSNTAGKIKITGPAAGLSISGGGITRVFQVDAGVTASISDVAIVDGNAASGGGLYNQGITDLTACTISGNSASGNGGGLSNTGMVTLTDCTLSGNSAAGGGGLANSGTAHLFASTLSGNSANVGGGIDNLAAASVVLEDTIVAANTGAGGSPSDVGGSNSASATGTYDLVGPGGSGGISNGSGHDIVLSALTGLGLTPLFNYGGPTQTMALLPGSPAIGAGTVVNGISTDQRGEPLDSPNPDIGAFQSQGFAFTPVTGSTPQSALTGDTFANPLAVTVAANNPDEPVAGGIVTFTAEPASDGASAILSSQTAIVGANGIAQVTATANSTAGPYTVAASAGGAATADFNLANLLTIDFSGILGQSITFGTASVTVTGTLADGSMVPLGEDVDVTLNSVTQPATIGSGGDFSTTFTNTSGLSVTGSPYTISYMYTSDGTFASASTTSSLTVTKATPTITWSNPADITYGTALSATQLDATAPVAGTLTYNPAAGAILKAGAGQKLSVSFRPTDTADYSTATDMVTINVEQAAPTITWSNPADIAAGTALSATQLDATASVPGTFTYSPPAGTVLKVGAGQTLSASFTPTDTTDYTTAADTVTINVREATPTITWPNPADIAYGTALSATQLDATASVPGTFTYNPPLGTVLKPGTGQTLSVSFTPTDTTDYTTATGTAMINVDKATPTITWSSPADITYGTALSAAQLDATASVPGTLTYSPPVGTVLKAGAGQTLSVSFMPADTTDYTTAAGTATINVDKAAVTITWSNPANITFGTALSTTQLDATASVPGAFTYVPAAGAFLNAGNSQTLSATFTPQDLTDYTTAAATATIIVEKATPTLKLSDAGGAYDGSPFPASVTIAGSGEENAPAASLEGVNPTLTYYDGSGTAGTGLGSAPPTAAGTYTVVASFAGTADYFAVESAPVTFTIGPATATITLASSTGSTVYGQAITFVATVRAPITPSGTVTFLEDGTTLATVPLDSSGTATLNTAGLALGPHAITATYSGDAALHGVQSGSASESVARAGTVVVLVPHPVLKKKKVVSEILTAEIKPPFPGGGFPTGLVTFELLTKNKKKIKTKVLGRAAVGGGSATLTVKANLVLSKVITIVYSGDTDFSMSTLTAPKLSKHGL